MAENVLEVKFSLSNIKEKKGRETVLKEIKKNVCALLNTNGGKLVLTASDATADNNIDADIIIRPIELYFVTIIGPYEVHTRFHVMEVKYNVITLDIQALPILCTLNTQMLMPTNTGIIIISCMEQDALRYILFQRRIVENLEHQEMPEQFFSGSSCGFFESKTVQFKHIGTVGEKVADFADRVIINKVTNIISAFANADGGNIFYGINNNGIVEGEQLSDLELQKTTEKLEKAVGKMIWRDESRKVERGREWDIKFVPVKNCDNETIPSTFVMVVTVHPYIGGVFTKEPESYYVEDGEVKEMSFDSWKQNTYYKVPTPLQEVERSNWSSERNGRKYMKITQKLKNLRQLGKWYQIESIANKLIARNDLIGDTKLTCLFQIVAVYYRQGDFEKAGLFLGKFRNYMGSAEDKSVFGVNERYSTSAIERSRGNYRAAWKIIDDCLQLAHHAPAGYLPASVYANAASIISSLVDEENFIDEIKDDKDIKGKIHELVEMAKSFCHYALQHLLYIEDEFEISREDLNQRINITLASLHLKSADADLSAAASPDNETSKAKTLIEKSDQSLMNLKGTERLMFNSCHLSLGKSDFYWRMYQLKSEFKRMKYLDESLRFVHEAREPADMNSFEEIKMLCEKRLQKIKIHFKSEKDDEMESVDAILDELLS